MTCNKVSFLVLVYIQLTLERVPELIYESQFFRQQNIINKITKNK